MFEADGQKMSNREVQDAYQKKFGKRFSISSPLWMKLVVVAFFILCATGWRYEQHDNITNNEFVTINHHVEFLGWEFPAYKVVQMPYNEYLMMKLKGGNLNLGHDISEVYVKDSGAPIESKTPIEAPAVVLPASN